MDGKNWNSTHNMTLWIIDYSLSKSENILQPQIYAQ